MKQQIVFIAPDNKLANKAKEVLAKINDGIEVFEGSLSKGVIIAKSAIETGAKIIISRGGTAALIKKELNTVVVEVEFSGYDIINVLKRAISISPEVGVVGFADLICSFEKLRDVFPIHLKTSMVKNEREVEKGVYDLVSKGSEVIIGGTAVVNATAKYGIKSVLLETGEESIISALKKAREILQAQLKEKEKTEILKSIIDFTYDGIIGVDRDGKITVFNPVAEKLVDKKSENIIGRLINEIIPNTGLLRIIKKGKAELGQFQEINGKTIATNRVPIIVNEEVRGAVATFQEIEKLQRIERQIRKKIYSKGHLAKHTFNDIIGTSETLVLTKNKAKRYASVDSNILVIGETGTGKEIFAQSIHNSSSRSTEPFVAVNCAALPESILESELFGYVEGAFTGAKKEGKLGLFELAHNGTIFLDEISEMSLKIQARFLRVIQEKEVNRIGDDKVIPVDIRIIAASNKDLLKLVEQSSFREDLYYRLCVLLLKLPPLRDRKEDIDDLAGYFISYYSKKFDKIVRDISKDGMELLNIYNWPGNIRQLSNLLERVVVLSDGNTIEENMIIEVFHDWGYRKEDSLLRVDLPDYGDLGKLEKDAIRKVLQETKGNKTKAAQKLGISTTTLWRKLKSI